jgi:hypothetical protein
MGGTKTGARIRGCPWRLLFSEPPQPTTHMETKDRLPLFFPSHTYSISRAAIDHNLAYFTFLCQTHRFTQATCSPHFPITKPVTAIPGSCWPQRVYDQGGEPLGSSSSCSAPGSFTEKERNMLLHRLGFYTCCNYAAHCSLALLLYMSVLCVACQANIFRNYDPQKCSI